MPKRISLRKKRWRRDQLLAVADPKYQTFPGRGLPGKMDYYLERHVVGQDVPLEQPSEDDTDEEVSRIAIQFAYFPEWLVFYVF